MIKQFIFQNLGGGAYEQDLKIEWQTAENRCNCDGRSSSFSQHLDPSYNKTCLISYGSYTDPNTGIVNLCRGINSLFIKHYDSTSTKKFKIKIRVTLNNGGPNIYVDGSQISNTGSWYEYERDPGQSLYIRADRETYCYPTTIEIRNATWPDNYPGFIITFKGACC